MIYVACDAVDGEASIVDDDELDAVAWATLGELPEFVPYGLFDPVKQIGNLDLAATPSKPFTPRSHRGMISTPFVSGNR